MNAAQVEAFTITTTKGRATMRKLLGLIPVLGIMAGCTAQANTPGTDNASAADRNLDLAYTPRVTRAEYEMLEREVEQLSFDAEVQRDQMETWLIERHFARFRDPLTEHKAYQTFESRDLGPMAVTVADVQPLAGGSRVTFELANASTIAIDGFALIVQWEKKGTLQREPYPGLRDGIGFSEAENILDDAALTALDDSERLRIVPAKKVQSVKRLHPGRSVTLSVHLANVPPAELRAVSIGYLDPERVLWPRPDARTD